MAKEISFDLEKFKKIDEISQWLEKLLEFKKYFSELDVMVNSWEKKDLSIIKTEYESVAKVFEKNLLAFKGFYSLSLVKLTGIHKIQVNALLTQVNSINGKMEIFRKGFEVLEPEKKPESEEKTEEKTQEEPQKGKKSRKKKEKTESETQTTSQSSTSTTRDKYFISVDQAEQLIAKDNRNWKNLEIVANGHRLEGLEKYVYTALLYVYQNSYADPIPCTPEMALWDSSKKVSIGSVDVYWDQPQKNSRVNRSRTTIGWTMTYLLHVYQDFQDNEKKWVALYEKYAQETNTTTKNTIRRQLDAMGMNWFSMHLDLIESRDPSLAKKSQGDMKILSRLKKAIIGLYDKGLVFWAKYEYTSKKSGEKYNYDILLLNPQSLRAMSQFKNALFDFSRDNSITKYLPLADSLFKDHSDRMYQESVD